MSTPPARPSAGFLTEGLRVAWRGSRAAILLALNDLPDPGEQPASVEHRWLWAELHYRRGDFATASLEFDRFTHQSTPKSVPPWMLFLARLRTGYSCFRMGDSRRAEAELRAAEDILLASPELDAFEADAEALRAHLLEIEGSSELARARFVQAHHLALRAGRNGRAATTASDIGRLLTDPGRVADALEWQFRALELARGSTDGDLISRTIEVRIAKLELAMVRLSHASRRLSRVLQSCSDKLTPEAQIAAWMASSEELLLRPRATGKEFDSAEKLLRQASSLAGDLTLKPLLCRIERERAKLFLTDLAPGAGRETAQRHFASAVQQAMALNPTPGLILQDLAEDLIEFKSLIPGSLERVKGYRDLLEERLANYRGRLRPKLQGVWRRRVQRRTTYTALRNAIKSYVEPPDQDTHTVLVCKPFEFLIGFKELLIQKDGKEISRFPQLHGRAVELMALPDRRMSATSLADELDSSENYVQQIVSDIRGIVGNEVLPRERKGKRAVYALRGAERLQP